jgi:hypothetical protein
MYIHILIIEITSYFGQQECFWTIQYKFTFDFDKISILNKRRNVDSFCPNFFSVKVSFDIIYTAMEFTFVLTEHKILCLRVNNPKTLLDC